jgi:hypothetical protein
MGRYDSGGDVKANLFSFKRDLTSLKPESRTQTRQTRQTRQTHSYRVLSRIQSPSDSRPRTLPLRPSLLAPRSITVFVKHRRAKLFVRDKTLDRPPPLPSSYTQTGLFVDPPASLSPSSIGPTPSQPTVECPVTLLVPLETR